MVLHPTLVPSREKVAASYRGGLCDAFALAVHRRTGWPLALWVGRYPDEDGEPGDTWDQPAHAVVCDPATDRWFDVDGWHQGQPDNLFFNEPPISIALVSSSVSEVTHAFAVVEGVSEAQVEQADRHLTEWDFLPSSAPSPRRRLR